MSDIRLYTGLQYEAADREVTIERSGPPLEGPLLASGRPLSVNGICTTKGQNLNLKRLVPRKALVNLF